jgi:hypothetical protein
LSEEKGNVANKKRFHNDYSASTLFLPKTNPKPDDYNSIFNGNLEDNFKIGISLTKKTIKVSRTTGTLQFWNWNNICVFGSSCLLVSIQRILLLHRH